MDDTTLAALAAFPAALARHFHAIPPAWRHRRPDTWRGIPSEELTAIEQLCHVLDVEVEGYQRRFQRTRGEHDPWLPSLDTDALARERAYGRADPETVLAQFGAARARTVALLAEMTPQDLLRPARFEGYGAVTLRGLGHFLCSHDQQHLAGLQWLLGKFASADGEQEAR